MFGTKIRVGRKRHPFDQIGIRKMHLTHGTTCSFRAFMINASRVMSISHKQLHTCFGNVGLPTKLETLPFASSIPCMRNKGEKDHGNHRIGNMGYFL